MQLRTLRKNEKRKKFNVKKAKKELDILWSKAVRGRDKICRKCRKAPATQAAHIFSRGNLSTRWDIRNGWGSDYYCHILWSHREPIEFAEWIRGDIGENEYQVLKAQAKKIYDSSNLKKDFETIKEKLTG